MSDGDNLVFKDEVTPAGRRERRGRSNPKAKPNPPLPELTVPSHFPLTQEPFGFEVELDVSRPLIAFDDAAQLHGRFRHHAGSSIELGPAVSGAINLGVKLYRGGGGVQLFEDRMVTDVPLIEPNVWTGVSLRIPRAVINFHENYLVVADLVKEDEFWFASRGEAELVVEARFQDGMPSPVQDDIILESKARPTFPSTPMLGPSGDSPTDKLSAAAVHLVFDVSDLIQYFHDARLPTGIQRVQIEVITNLVFSLPDDCSLKIGCFTKKTDTWIELPPLFFNHICKVSLINGDPLAPEWLRALEELRMHTEQAKRLIFRRGAYLINLGTSWWLQNYFLNVRAAKAQYGIRYVPFVHDCIPIMSPEHCVEGLTRDFITWALGAFHHADHIMVNSRATAADVKLVAGELGHSIEEPHVVTLDADYRAANARLPVEVGGHANTDLFLKNDFRPGEYVLFVSTIESRKNHLMAFSAWLSLAKKFGARRVPKLVCVGNRGWLNDAIFAKLSASKILQDRVTLLSRISDPDLELLYRNCLFTTYPSSYEGWGLPITESLCFGKVPVLANSSSLPEAGGEFGEYFDLGSESEFLQKLELMIFDVDYRTEREKRIAAQFRPRPWTAIGNQILALVRDWASTDPPIDEGKQLFTTRGLWPFRAEPGRFYGLTENEHTHIWRGMVAGEMFRQGDGWWWTEPWGCWTKPKVARLAFLAQLKNARSAVLYVGIRGVQRGACRATVALEGAGRRVVTLKPEQSQWLVFRIAEEALRTFPRSVSGFLFEMLFSADRSVDFRDSTDGVDQRVASIGVIGFMICSGEDVDSRLRFIESVTLDDFGGLIMKPNDL